MTLGTRLRDLRTEKDLTQADMASIVGKSLSAYKLWENDINEPNLDALILMGDFFKVSVDYLIGRAAESYRDVPDDIEFELTPNQRGDYLEVIRMIKNAVKYNGRTEVNSIFEIFGLLAKYIPLLCNEEYLSTELCNDNLSYDSELVPEFQLPDKFNQLETELLQPLRALFSTGILKVYKHAVNIKLNYIVSLEIDNYIQRQIHKKDENKKDLYRSDS